jgi:hypothetical protein
MNMGLFSKKKDESVPVPKVSAPIATPPPRVVIPVPRLVVPAIPTKPTGSGFPEKKISLVLTDFTPGGVILNSGFLENPKLGERVSRLLYREFVREEYEEFLKGVEQKNLDVQEEQKRYLEEFAKLEEELYGKKLKSGVSTPPVPDDVPPLEEEDDSTSYGEE